MHRLYERKFLGQRSVYRAAYGKFGNADKIGIAVGALATTGVVAHAVGSVVQKQKREKAEAEKKQSLKEHE